MADAHYEAPLPVFHEYDHEAHPCKAQQPNAGGADVSHADSLGLSQSQVGDGVNNSQVALHTGQDGEEHLSIPGERPDQDPHPHHHTEIGVASDNGQSAPQYADQLHDRHVVGDKVRESHDSC